MAGDDGMFGPATTCGADNKIGCHDSPPCPEHRQRHWAAARLVEQLHKAVYGATWARSDTPADVWDILLREVRALVHARQMAAEENRHGR